MNQRRCTLALAMGILLVLVAPLAGAAPITWTGAVDDNWTTPGNWSPGVPVAGDTAVFDGSGVGPVDVAGANPSVDGVDLSAGGYSLIDPSGTGSLTLNSLTNSAGANAALALISSPGLTATSPGELPPSAVARPATFDPYTAAFPTAGTAIERF